MDFGLGGNAGGSGGDDKDQGSHGSEGLKRNWNDLEAAKNALVKENAEKSAKISRLMQDNDRLVEQTVFRLENPLFPGSNEPMPLQNPFAVFPAEVWEPIIENMNRSSDLVMLCQAFPRLEPWVTKRKKTIAMFKNVLPLICKHLVGKDIKNCRLVCASWNADVCTLLANWKSPNLIPDADDALSNNQIASERRLPDQALDEKFTLGLFAYLFKDHTRIEYFLKKMADYLGNPLFGRFLCLSVNDKTDLIHFWKSVSKLVRKYGEHVWNLKIECLRGSHNQISFYQAIQETLIHLPNLKYLTVDCNFTGQTGQGSSKANVALQIGNSPLPPLPYLQRLKVACTSETGMSSALSFYFSPQIRRLELDKDSFANLKDECLLGLINLEHLQVELQSKEDVLRLLKFPNPNLKKLCLHAQCFPAPPVSFTPEQFASLLEKFSRLERLDINRIHGEPSTSFGSTRMQFSGLNTLEIAVGIGEDDRQHNLDFLLWFSSLKHLMIKILFLGRVNLGNRYDSHSTLKIRSYLLYGQMLDSNIWTLIPSLELLEVRGTLCTPRGIYLKYNENVTYTREMFEIRVD